jgi:hypothetical protein
MVYWVGDNPETGKTAANAKQYLHSGWDGIGVLYGQRAGTPL